MQAFPTSYAPQSGYPTQGPYNPGVQGPPPDQIQQPAEVMPDPNSPDIQPVPPQMQPQMPPPMQPQMASTPYNYYPQQTPQMGGYMPPNNERNWYQSPPLPLQPRIDNYPPMDSDDDDESSSECQDSECHEVIGITLGGKPCPPPQNPVVCCDCKLHRKTKKTLKKKCKRSKHKEKPKEGESPCAHTFCIIERAKVKPVGRPWASGLYKYQPAPEEPPKTKVIRRKCECATQKGREEEYDNGSSSSMSSSTLSTMSSASTATTGTSNQMLEFMEVFCSLLEMAKKKKKSQKKPKVHKKL